MTVLFVLPPNALAGYTFVGALLVLGAAWLGGVRRWFKGPRVHLAEEEAAATPPATPATDPIGGAAVRE
jgi:hypothetical protein